MIAHLFVYGSLRAGAGYRRAPDVSRHGVLIGNATMQGLLYNLGRYPGMVASKNPKHVVAGEVFRLEHPRRAFLILDAYEGQDFERKIGRVTVESGESLDAWVYLCSLYLRRKPRICSGDFLARTASMQPSRIL